jgi:ABC-type polysaccharide/polyol phosphate export permease
MYDITMLPSYLQKLVFLNPMTSLTLLYRGVTFYGEPMQFDLLLFVAVVSVAVLALGMWMFGRLQRNFAEVI